MTKLNQVYKCQTCESIVVVVHEGSGDLVCCDKPMKLLEEQTEELGYEKHVPVIEKTEKGVLVKIGAIPHPMLKEHHIEWVEVTAGGKAYRQFLKPGDKPEAEFYLEAEVETAREYCNVHGLWKNK